MGVSWAVSRVATPPAGESGQKAPPRLSPSHSSPQPGSICPLPQTQSGAVVVVVDVVVVAIVVVVAVVDVVVVVGR